MIKPVLWDHPLPTAPVVLGQQSRENPLVEALRVAVNLPWAPPPQCWSRGEGWGTGAGGGGWRMPHPPLSRRTPPTPVSREGGSDFPGPSPPWLLCQHERSDPIPLLSDTRGFGKAPRLEGPRGLMLYRAEACLPPFPEMLLFCLPPSLALQSCPFLGFFLCDAQGFGPCICLVLGQTPSRIQPSRDWGFSPSLFTTWK